MKIAIFASGSGSNFQALIDDVIIRESVALLVCDKPGAFVLERAEAAGIPAFLFSPKTFVDKVAFEQEIVAKLKESEVEFLVLAGYMRLIGETLLTAYENKIINLHPSLLPEFPGKDAIGQAMDAGVLKTGVTAHFVDAGMDTGPIIAQQSVAILPEDTLDILTTRIHKVEHAFYPEVVKKNNRGTNMKRALISVSDKTGVVEFAQSLVELGFEIISTGGTKKALEDSAVPVIGIEEVTNFPEMLDGRVKTLHPAIHGGLLARRDDATHMAAIEAHDIAKIDLVCVNLYPFQETIAKPGVKLGEAIENIDIGGPSMLRSAAKNYAAVTVVVDSVDYAPVLAELGDHGAVTFETNQRLAAKVFRHTAAYDALIAGYLTDIVGDEFPEKLTLTYNKKTSFTLR